MPLGMRAACSKFDSDIFLVRKKDGAEKNREKVLIASVLKNNETLHCSEVSLLFSLISNIL